MKALMSAQETVLAKLDTIQDGGEEAEPAAPTDDVEKVLEMIRTGMTDLCRKCLAAAKQPKPQEETEEGEGEDEDGAATGEGGEDACEDQAEQLPAAIANAVDEEMARITQYLKANLP